MPAGQGEPIDAERARTLVAAGRSATLSTMSVDPAGFPFCSLVGYAVDAAGRPLLCLSDLAEHSRNLAVNPRGSIMVTGTGPGDPLALARVTLLGEITALPEGDPTHHTATLARYREAHPDAFYIDFADFRLYRLEVAAVRYVGGFGRMSWVGADQYTAAEPDPLRPHRARIVDHMNDDHADALVTLCRVLGDRPGTVTARMVDVDRYGFSVLAGDAPDGDHRTVRIAFHEPVSTPAAVRAAMVDLVRRTRG